MVRCEQRRNAFRRGPSRRGDEQRSSVVAHGLRQRRAETRQAPAENGRPGLRRRAARRCAGRVAARPWPRSACAVSARRSAAAMHGGDGIDDVLAGSRHGSAPRPGRSDASAPSGSGCRASGRPTFQGERDGHAPTADRDEEARPGGLERLVRGDGAEQTPGRHAELQPCWEAAGPLYREPASTGREGRRPLPRQCLALPCPPSRR